VKTSTKQITKQWVKINEAARFLGVSQDTLRRWEKKGTLIPRRTVGGHRRYSRKQLERVLKQPMATLLEKPSTHKPATRISVPPQTATTTMIYKTQTKDDSIYKKVTKYTKSWLFLVAVTIIIASLLIASYILLQITKYQKQPEPISPVPSYKTITLP
jgi:excisionase family DNA binding protein